MMPNTETKAGVFAGVCFTVLGQIQNSFIETVLLAALGATVGFGVSRFLQWFFKKD